MTRTHREAFHEDTNQTQGHELPFVQKPKKLGSWEGRSVRAISLAVLAGLKLKFLGKKKGPDTVWSGTNQILLLLQTSTRQEIHRKGVRW